MKTTFIRQSLIKCRYRKRRPHPPGEDALIAQILYFPLTLLPHPRKPIHRQHSGEDGGTVGAEPLEDAEVLLRCCLAANRADEHRSQRNEREYAEQAAFPFEASDCDQDQGDDRQGHDQGRQHVDVDEGLRRAVVAAAGEREERVADGGDAVHDREECDAETQHFALAPDQNAEIRVTYAGQDLVDCCEATRHNV